MNPKENSCLARVPSTQNEGIVNEKDSVKQISSYGSVFASFFKEAVSSVMTEGSEDETTSCLVNKQHDADCSMKQSVSLVGIEKKGHSDQEMGIDETSSHHFSVNSTQEESTRIFKSMHTQQHLAENLTDSVTLRQIALNVSLYVNLAILATKIVAFAKTLSLAVLAATVDSVLDVISQLVLSYAERTSERKVGRSSAQYPAGAARLEPIGVLTCAALMGMASFEVIKESVEALISEKVSISTQSVASVWNMAAIVIVKLLLLVLCRKAGEERSVSNDVTGGMKSAKAAIVVSDPTMEALALDHLNDALSNAVAAVALLLALIKPWLWFVDPVGAIAISIYIIYSWYTTGKEQIEQLTGKAAPDDFIEEIYQLASNHDSRIVVDWVRAYHFGPKFLVELEVVLPKNTLLCESHDIGMDLQYEIEGREEVERCFVHIDYEKRDYDEHVVSKVPELLEKYRNSESFARSASY